MRGSHSITVAAHPEHQREGSARASLVLWASRCCGRTGVVWELGYLAFRAWEVDVYLELWKLVKTPTKAPQTRHWLCIRNCFKEKVRSSLKQCCK